jgi:chemotaxis protein MotB
MKYNIKHTLIFACILFIFGSCVTQKEYNALLDNYMNAQLNNKSLTSSYDSLEALLEAERSKLSQSVDQLRTDSAELATLIENMKTEMDELNAQKAQLENESAEKLKNADLKNQKTSAELTQMQVDLEKQKLELDKALADLKAREAKITELENLLNEQKNKSEALKHAIKNALTNFNAGELSVYTKNGKVYVSMSDKLLFKSGSTTVEPKGVDALGKLAEVIKKNPDIAVNVEGHTDNVPYASSSGLIKDNWDLSLMRASSVLHLLTEKYKVSSKQVIGSGRGEFYPIESNSTADGRAKNRRTDIILTPKVDKLLDMLGQ